MKHLIIALYFLCTLENVASQSLFDLLSAKSTNINFENTIVDTDSANIFFYSAFYSGSGVAIGDINNDGLPDVYFGGNQVSDALYINKGNLKFENITKKAGILDKGGWTSGVNMVDVNQDGYMDIYVCKTLYNEYPNLRKNELYINDGDGTFTESADEYGLADIWRSQQASFFDYDKDGDLDVYIVNQPPNPGFLSPLKPYDWRDPALAGKLMRNENGLFEDVTKAANLFDKGYPLSVTVADYNNDGWSDIYVTHDYNSPDKLYINQRKGTFKNTIDASMGHISYFGMGADAADINNDGLMDHIVVDMVAEDNYRVKANMSGMNPLAFWRTVEEGGHYQYMLNTLQLNLGNDDKGVVRFSEVSQFSGVAYTDWSWSPLLADFDNDGFKDIVITNGLLRDIRNNDSFKKAIEYLAPYKSLIDSYIEKPESINLWNHFSLDSLLSLYPTVPLTNYIFKNTGDYEFKDKTTDWGLGQKGFTVGLAYADLDLDGDLDLVFNNINAPASIYENKSTELNDNNYLPIDIITPKGISIFGTKIMVITNTNTLYHELTNARGFYSTSDYNLVVGLGNKDKKVDVKVIWSDGNETNLKKIKVNNKLHIDYSLAIKEKHSKVENSGKFLTNPTVLNGVGHRENVFDDYEREVLLPHKMSEVGPKVAFSKKSQLLFIPGALGFSGKVYSKKLKEFSLLYETDPENEEVSGSFVDLDNDGDEDLIVVVGGNEEELNGDNYKSFVLLNQNGLFVKSNLDFNSVSGALALTTDYDNDGDIDILIAGRQIPGKYPAPASTYIYKNILSEEGVLAFEDVTKKICPELTDIGLVTDGVWQDIDGDKDIDLILVGEWMPVKVFKNENGLLINKSKEMGLTGTNGWWNTIKSFDLDYDGDIDYILGNLGTNYKYKASKEEPFKLFYNDYDTDGSNDIVLSFYEDGEEFPVRGRECSSQQVPDIKSEFKDYNSFASSNVYDIYGIGKINESYKLEVTMFESVIMENIDNNHFTLYSLPAETQFSSINTLELYDFDSNGYVDVIYGGNKYGSEIETPRADASVGGVLLNYGKMNFKYVPANKSGLYLNGEIKDIKIIEWDKEKHLLAFPNNSEVVDYTIVPKNN